MKISAQPEIVDLEEPIKLIGRNMEMSIQNHQGYKLWSSFRKELASSNYQTDTFYDVMLYPQHYFASFQQERSFVQWACVEFQKTDQASLFEELEIPPGSYAKFLFNGMASEAAEGFAYIFNDWLPKSAFQLRDAAHFNKLMEAYDPLSKDSMEEIFIPIWSKTS